MPPKDGNSQEGNEPVFYNRDKHEGFMLVYTNNAHHGNDSSSFPAALIDLGRRRLPPEPATPTIDTTSMSRLSINAQQSEHAEGSTINTAVTAHTSADDGHTDYVKVLTRNAKCDICEERNRTVMQKCKRCGMTTCDDCHQKGHYDSRHNLALFTLDWTHKDDERRKANRSRNTPNNRDELDALYEPSVKKSGKSETHRQRGLVREPTSTIGGVEVSRAGDRRGLFEPKPLWFQHRPAQGPSNVEKPTNAGDPANAVESTHDAEPTNAVEPTHDAEPTYDVESIYDAEPTSPAEPTNVGDDFSARAAAQNLGTQHEHSTIDHMKRDMSIEMDIDQGCDLDRRMKEAVEKEVSFSSKSSVRDGSFILKPRTATNSTAREIRRAFKLLSAACEKIEEPASRSSLLRSNTRGTIYTSDSPITQSAGDNFPRQQSNLGREGFNRQPESSGDNPALGRSASQVGSKRDYSSVSDSSDNMQTERSPKKPRQEPQGLYRPVLWVPKTTSTQKSEPKPMGADTDNPSTHFHAAWNSEAFPVADKLQVSKILAQGGQLSVDSGGVDTHLLGRYKRHIKATNNWAATNPNDFEQQWMFVENFVAEWYSDRIQQEKLESGDLCALERLSGEFSLCTLLQLPPNSFWFSWSEGMRQVLETKR
ncbi:hypothetical protein F5Y19DRAFT_476562 [Xylariaceae sp. FL1651]|nr:hypothetical protein F5Y19DRAFT_476562 [Xylariaceae sp. FL1651]